MSYAERRRRKNLRAKTPVQVRQAAAKAEGRHIHPQEAGYWREYPGRFHREGCVVPPGTASP